MRVALICKDKPGALQTLHDTIDVVTRLMAPLVPFMVTTV